MKFFYEPKTYLVAEPLLRLGEVFDMLHEEEYGDWDAGPDKKAVGGERLIELMGRLCYRSFGAKQGRIGNKAYIDNIKAHRHGSVMEHANWSFVVTRCGRGYTHQQVRRRAGWAYSQESSHFIEYAANSARASLPGFDKLMGQEDLIAARIAVEDAVMAYSRAMGPLKEAIDEQGALKAGKAKKARCGTARALLPNAVESCIGFTANARALRWFLALRGAEDNTIEIRMVAAQVLEKLKGATAHLFADYEAYEGADGFPAVRPLGGVKE